MKHHSSKRQGSQGSWMKYSSGDTIPKRSLSLDSRSRRGPRDVSVENLDRRNLGKDNFLLLSQEKMNEHKAKVVQCKFNAVGNLVASCDSEGALKVWHPEPNVKVRSTTQFKSGFTALSWLIKNERLFVTGTVDGVLRLHESLENATVCRVVNEDLKSEILSVSCSPSGCNIACSVDSKFQEANLLIYDVKTNKMENALSLGSNLKINCCHFNHNGSLVIAGCTDGTVRMVDLRNGDCVCTWDAHQGTAVSAIQLTSDHNVCYSFGRDHKLCKHDLAHTGEPTLSVQLPNCNSSLLHGTQAFSLHQSGKHVLTACGHHGASIYHVSESGVQPMLQLGDHKSALTTCDWSTANQCATCLSSSADGKIKVSMILTP